MYWRDYKCTECSRPRQAVWVWIIFKKCGSMMASTRSNIKKDESSPLGTPLSTSLALSGRTGLRLWLASPARFGRTRPWLRCVTLPRLLLGSVEQKNYTNEHDCKNNPSYHVHDTLLLNPARFSSLMSKVYTKTPMSLQPPPIQSPIATATS